MKKKKNHFLIYIFISILIVFLFFTKNSFFDKDSISYSKICLTKPQFENYEVKDLDWYSGQASSVRFSNNNIDQLHQTMIRRAVSRGVNFAGKYVIAEWGCGSSCQKYAIVNAKTGKVVVDDLESSYGADYQKNSILLVINPSLANWSGIRKMSGTEPAYYVIEKDKLIQIFR